MSDVQLLKLTLKYHHTQHSLENTSFHLFLLLHQFQKKNNLISLKLYDIMTIYHYNRLNLCMKAMLKNLLLLP